MDLSIVIPAFNEGLKVARDVAAAARFLVSSHLTGEILVVDDGSSDSTAEAAGALPVPPGVERRVIRLEANQGKGAAVRTGMLESRGDYAMFADSGVCVPYENALRGLDLLRSGQCDLAHGSRKMRESVIRIGQPLHRRVMSRLFRWAAHLTVGIPSELTDTQCGFKLYRGPVARELFEACETRGFLFDVEVLLLALARGYRVREFPVEWACDLDSRLRPARTGYHVLAQLLAIKCRLARG
jgi:dolichyl-phosphate beta-glucosyltransferase